MSLIDDYYIGGCDTSSSDSRNSVLPPLEKRQVIQGIWQVLAKGGWMRLGQPLLVTENLGSQLLLAAVCKIFSLDSTDCCFSMLMPYMIFIDAVSESCRSLGNYPASCFV